MGKILPFRKPIPKPPFVDDKFTRIKVNLNKIAILMNALDLLRSTTIVDKKTR